MNFLDRRLTLAEAVSPALVIQCELDSQEDGTFVDLGDHAVLWCLYRRSGTPVDVRLWDVRDIGTLPLSIVRDAGADLRAVPEERVPASGEVSTITVVICTRDRTDDLLRALASLVAQSDPTFDVLVVDNVEEPGDTRRAVGQFAGLSLRYIHEPRAGLSVARNTGVRHVQSDIVAWMDDDEEADVGWIAAIREAFRHPSRPTAVAGLMAPAQLETRAQLLFEQYGGFNKGRGLASAVLRASTPTVVNPLLPLPNFGAGGNMAFKTAALRDIGEFDPCLGAGTLTHGGEETRAFSLLLLRGETILYWPRAITWHYHRLTITQLEKVFYGYSAGLSAFYVSMLRRSPGTIVDILKILPWGVREVLTQRGSERNAELPIDFPSGLLALSRRGLAAGAALYLRQWLKDARRRARHQTAAPT